MLSLMRSFAPQCHAFHGDDGLVALLALGEVEAVVSALPAQAQAAIIHAALLAGKHVLSEKPAGATVEEAALLLAFRAALLGRPLWRARREDEAGIQTTWKSWKQSFRKQYRSRYTAADGYCPSSSIVSPLYGPDSSPTYVAVGIKSRTKLAVYQRPVVFAFFAEGDFSLYGGGGYNPARCTTTSVNGHFSVQGMCACWTVAVATAGHHQAAASERAQRAAARPPPTLLKVVRISISPEQRRLPRLLHWSLSELQLSATPQLPTSVGLKLETMEFAKWLGQQVFNAIAGDGTGGGSGGLELIHLQCGKTCFHGVPANMRTELWLSQLQRGGGTGAVAAHCFPALLEQSVPAAVLDEIDKDMHRTFAGHPRLSSEEGQAAMRAVLVAYAAMDAEIGYTQGMNFLAGLLLTYIESPAEAFGALVLLMHDRGLRELYLPDMRLLQVRLWQLGRLLPAQLSAHLEAHAVLPVLYASSWLLTCFASDFPIAFAARVLDLVITDCWAAPMLKARARMGRSRCQAGGNAVAVGIMRQCEMLLLEMEDFEMMVDVIRQDIPKWPAEELQELLTEALSKPWTPRQLKVLEQINGAETVIEAVQRVDNLRAATSDASELEPSARLVSCSFTSSLSSFPAALPVTEGGAAAGADEAAEAAEPAEPAGGDAGGRTLTPRTAAAAEVLRVNPLPPPLAGRLDGVAWAQWAAAKGPPSVPALQESVRALQSMPSSKARIELDIGEHLELEKRLSMALSLYQGSSPHPASSPSATTQATPAARAPPPAAGGGAAAAARPENGAAKGSKQAPSSTAEAAAPAAGPPRLATVSPPPSPFAQLPPDTQAQWLAAVQDAERGAGDGFGSFAGATSRVALLEQPVRTRQQPAQQPEPAADAGEQQAASPLQAFLNLFALSASPPEPAMATAAQQGPALGSQQRSTAPGAGSVAGRLELPLEGLALGSQQGSRAAREAQQQSAPPAGAPMKVEDVATSLDQFGSWKTATTQSPPTSIITMPARSSLDMQQSSDLASCASSGAQPAQRQLALGAAGSGGVPGKAPGYLKRLEEAVPSGARVGLRLSPEDVKERATSLAAARAENFGQSGKP
eukprot:scaffold1.g5325.t1